ncbi:MAG TPA: hypothetical protein VL652_05470 [Kutzneria sp.]|jgi:hypothetical protein|nr:hypothetical protein [Kutzneria sp.]
MRPEPGQVLHFSEDPTITVFEPHVAATAKHAEPYVWAVDHDRAPDYWFPRQCPRAMAWAEESTTEDDRLRIIGDEQRVHAVEYGWLEAMRTVELYAYRLPADHFESFGGYCHVSTRTVRPLGPPERVGDLFALHVAAGIQLRVLPNLWPFWDRVTASSLGFSGTRLGNACPRGQAHPVFQSESRSIRST